MTSLHIYVHTRHVDTHISHTDLDKQFHLDQICVDLYIKIFMLNNYCVASRRFLMKIFICENIPAVWYQHTMKPQTMHRNQVQEAL